MNSSRFWFTAFRNECILFGKMCISDLTEKHIINKELSSTDLVEDATSKLNSNSRKIWSSKWCNYKDKSNDKH